MSSMPQCKQCGNYVHSGPVICSVCDTTNMKRLEDWAVWIVNRPPVMRDLACEECYPNSEILIDGFRCAYHDALHFLANDMSGGSDEG
jgi:hypothetical protein